MIKKLVAAQLFIVYGLLFTVSPVFAQSTPISCTAARWTDRFTKVVVEPRPEHVVTITRTVPYNSPPIPINTSTDLRLHFVIQEDFSKLSAIFAASNSNFLESKFQDQAHKQQNVTGLDSQNFNAYQGPSQKVAPQYMTDDLRIDFVDYVSRYPALKEAADTFTDVGGNNPRTIAVLVSTFGTPNPPSHGGSQAAWQSGWAPYWNKIPTAVNEFFVGFVNYGIAEGDQEWLGAISGGTCNYMPYHQHYFSMPDYFRSASVTNQINQIIVPQEAQSSVADFSADTLNNPTPLASIIENTKSTLKKINDSALITAVKKILKISFNFVNPLEKVYAQTCSWDPNLGREMCEGGEPNPQNTAFCPAPIPVLPNDKEGIGPFCGFQAEFRLYDNISTETTIDNLEDGETCLDSIHCTFIQDYPSQVYGVPNDPRWNGGSCVDNGSGYTCTTTIRLYPVYFFPLLAPIWNNNTYSDTADNIAIIGIDSLNQQTGRPGNLGFFTPLGAEYHVFPTGKNLPSEEQGGDEDVRQRFFGAVDNLKSFVKDRALKPCELQRYLGVANACQ